MHHKTTVLVMNWVPVAHHGLILWETKPRAPRRFLNTSGASGTLSKMQPETQKSKNPSFSRIFTYSRYTAPAADMLLTVLILFSSPRLATQRQDMSFAETQVMCLVWRHKTCVLSRDTRHVSCVKTQDVCLVSRRKTCVLCPDARHASCAETQDMCLV